MSDKIYADRMRKLGNQFYISQKYDDAITQYNLCLTFSGSTMEHQGLAYANRSAAYLGLNSYQDCLDSIRLAKECSLPTNVFQKVLAREKAAELSLKESKAVCDNKPPKLSYRRHKRISSFVYCLSSKDPHTPYQDFGIVTNKELQSGDVLIVEQALATLPGSVSECHNCLRQCGSLQRCDCSCLFCSPECKAQAFASYHKYECPLVEHLACFPNQSRLLLRVFFKLLQCFKNVRSLRKYLEDIKSPNPFEFDDSGEGSDQEFFKSQFRIYYALKEPIDVTDKDMHEIYGKVAIAIDLLKTVKETPLAAATTDDWSFLAEQLFRIIFNSCYTLKYIVNSRTGSKRRPIEVEIDHCCMNDKSLVIHGAASFVRFTFRNQANVQISYVNDVLIVTALKYIPIGSELLCSTEYVLVFFIVVFVCLIICIFMFLAGTTILMK